MFQTKKIGFEKVYIDVISLTLGDVAKVRSTRSIFFISLFFIAYFCSQSWELFKTL